MKIKTIRMLVLIIVFCALISVPLHSEKLSDSIYLKNEILKKNNFWNTWFVETVDTFGDVGQYTDIAIADNKVFISYYDFGKKDLKFACLINDEWSITVVDSDGDVGKYASLALDSLGNPHISYYDETLQALKHAYFNGIEWSIDLVDSSGNVGLDNSIAIDSNNNVHISYHDETNGDLKHAESIDNGWDIEVVDSFGDTGEISSITLDNKGNPHISYTNRYNFHLYHAYYVDDNWVIEKVDDNSVLYGSISITFDLDGFIHILYYDATPDHFSLKHAYDYDKVWYIETIDPYLWGTFGTGGANIFFDDLGRTHISYFNWAWQSINYAWKINGIWNLEVIDPSDWNGSYVGSYAALAVDSQGIPHVSYMDNNNLDLKYARKIGYSPSVPTSPSGNSRGKPGEIYTFTTTSQDLDNNKIQYGWDWNGDFQVDEWTGFINSSENCEISHSWAEQGSYKIRVIVKDEKGFTNGYHLNEAGEFSEWSDPLLVKISKSKISTNIVVNRIFIKFIEQIPLLQKIVTKNK